MVDESPWPLFMSLSIFSNMVMMVELLNLDNSSTAFFLLSVFFSLLVFFGWSRDIVKEGLMGGHHTIDVQNGLKMGMILFITSEVFFFISFFWSLFHVSVSTHVDIGGWPPMGINSVDPMKIPFLGTLILISSGISVTWGHHLMIEGNLKKELNISLCLTVCLGLLFTCFQLMEFYESNFTINDSVFGSVFFMATGFHGFHVIIGSLMLLICLLRSINDHLSSSHHVGLEAAIWYWHFVDVVWLFLYISLYWWSW
uniref:Cytochrome c oxidase subunit 3 n=1 Tax=Amyrsidea minuta TaxID=2364307 RepID=A0A386B2I1_9NEOP|nr:cytochrome c oxidase subunit III [Amyrsidea minuta]